MRKLVMTCLMAGITFGATDTLGLSAEMDRVARKGGARVRMTFHVKDTQGMPVTNVQVKAYFHFWHKDEVDRATFTTDTNGVCTVEGMCSIDMNCSFSKEGYYNTGFHRDIMTRDSVVKDGRWQPWNPTVEITLKEKRNPIPMCVRHVEHDMPKGERMGFDCGKGDWVKPYGKGETADFSVYYDSSIRDWRSDNRNHTNCLVFASEGGGGFIRLPKEGGQLVSAYEAHPAGYAPGLVLSYERKDGVTVSETTIPQDHYLMFRSRVERDGEGEVIRSRFGKITSFRYGEADMDGKRGYISFTYYFNPNENDRNLEYDGKTNLLDSRDPHHAP